MTRAPSYAEACVEAMEARWAFEAALERKRGENILAGLPMFRDIEDAGREEWAAYVSLDSMARALRPAPEAPTEADRADVRGDEKMEGRRA